MLFIVLLSMYICPTIIKNSVEKALSTCYNVLIPSVFPYLVITRILSESIIKYILTSSNKFAHKSSFVVTIAIFIGLISGFPNGAIIATRLYELKIITKKDAEKIVALSDCISPSFCIIYFGKYILNNTLCAVLIFLSIMVSNLCTLLIFGKNKSYTITLNNKNISFLSLPQLICDCCRIMLDICAFVTFFMCMGNLIITSFSLYFSLSPVIISSVISLLEITCGVMNIYTLEFSKQVLFGCFFFSFTGFCAITQVSAICERADIPVKNYLLSKILCSLLTPIIFILLIKIIPEVYLVSLFGRRNKVLIARTFFLTALILFTVTVSRVARRNKSNKYIKN